MNCCNSDKSIIQPEVFDVLIPYIVEFRIDSDDERYEIGLTLRMKEPRLFIKIEVPRNLMLDHDKINIYLENASFTVYREIGKPSTITGYIVDEKVAEYIHSKLNKPKLPYFV